MSLSASQRQPILVLQLLEHIPLDEVVLEVKKLCYQNRRYFETVSDSQIHVQCCRKIDVSTMVQDREVEGIVPMNFKFQKLTRSSKAVARDCIRVQDRLAWQASLVVLVKIVVH